MNKIKLTLIFAILAIGSISYAGNSFFNQQAYAVRFAGSISGSGIGSISCLNGHDFDAKISFEVSFIRGNLVNGKATIHDLTNDLTTQVVIDSGKIMGKEFKFKGDQLTSDTELCHAGDNSDYVVISGKMGDNKRINATLVCAEYGQDDIECVTGFGKFRGDVSIGD